ncbi:reverse transcriptase [Trichonephila clavipes]|nr:reverse transcriptase [Trichonephila clavipes]
MEKHQLPLLTTRRAPVQFYPTVSTTIPSKRLNLSSMASNKVDAIPEELKYCALETIEESYSENEWLHTNTDGSYLPETNGACAGWFCRLLEGSLAV